MWAEHHFKTKANADANWTAPRFHGFPINVVGVINVATVTRRWLQWLLPALANATISKASQPSMPFQERLLNYLNRALQDREFRSPTRLHFNLPTKRLHALGGMPSTAFEGHRAIGNRPSQNSSLWFQWSKWCVVAILFSVPATCFAQQSKLPSAKLPDEQIIQAFSDTSQGYSSDELLIQDSLRSDFLKHLNIDTNSTADAQRAALLRLLQLRKAGKLTVKATRRGSQPDSELSAIAEIAARVVTDRHRVSTDSMLADPKLRQELQSEAETIVPNVDGYSIRKLVLQLRKKRALKPELVLRVADWHRSLRTFSISDAKKALEADEIPGGPGVYLFRDKAGYLYIGEASNLRNRLRQHFDESDRPSLAEYLSSEAGNDASIELHVFPKDSPASKLTVRRAYESELIRSRKPKFNARP